MASFATVTDLSSLLGLALEPDDARATLALQVATALIQNAARQRIEHVADDVVELPGTWGQELWLPERPVLDVTSIEVKLPGGARYALNPAAYAWFSSGLVRLVSGLWGEQGNWGLALDYGGSWTKVIVSYDHGFAEIPDDLRGCCLSIGARIYANPEDLKTETIGNYSYGYSPRAAGGTQLTDEELRIIARYDFAAGVTAIDAS